MPDDSSMPRPIPTAPLLSPAGALPPRQRHSFSLWIALVAGCCVLLIPAVLIVSAIAIPQIFKFRKTANEASAVLIMHSIGQAETTYNTTYPANGYACTLGTLGGDPA